MRRIISLWLPTFATDRLGLKEFPFATVGEERGGLCIAAANDAAAQRGIFSGQALTGARALVPDLKTSPADTEGDTCALKNLTARCRRFTPWTAVEALNGDGSAGAWLDVSGCAHLFGGEEALAAKVLSHMEGLSLQARLGLADTPGAAWATARFMTEAKAPCSVIPEGAARQLLSGLPIAALRLEEKAIETLKRLGIRRLSDLIALPRAGLAARLGREPARRLDELLGLVDEPLSPDRPVAPLSARLAFPEPIGLMEDIAGALDRLLLEVCDRLEKQGRGARRLDLEAFRADGGVSALTVGTGRPVRDPAHMARLFRDKLKDLEAGFGFDLMALSVSVSEPFHGRQEALTKTEGNDDRLPLLLDRLGGRLGPGNIRRLAPRAAHIPEKAQVAASPLRPPQGPPWPDSPRPVRLFRRPLPVMVETDALDLPRAFHRFSRHHTLRHAEGPERIAAEWWHGAEPPGREAVRDYYRVEDGHGARFWLYRLPQPNSWFLHGFFG